MLYLYSLIREYDINLAENLQLTEIAFYSNLQTFQGFSLAMIALNFSIILAGLAYFVYLKKVFEAKAADAELENNISDRLRELANKRLAHISSEISTVEKKSTPPLKRQILLLSIILIFVPAIIAVTLYIDCHASFTVHYSDVLFRQIHALEHSENSTSNMGVSWLHAVLSNSELMSNLFLFYFSIYVLIFIFIVIYFLTRILWPDDKIKKSIERKESDLKLLDGLIVELSKKPSEDLKGSAEEDQRKRQHLNVASGDTNKLTVAELTK